MATTVVNEPATKPLSELTPMPNDEIKVFLDINVLIKVRRLLGRRLGW
jgi:hypothetical protein